MRLPRLTTRRWIVVVAIAAMSVEVYREVRLAAQYRLKACMHQQIECGSPTPVLTGAGRASGFFAFHVPDPEVASYHAALRQKYEYAALHPWLPVAPDPPPFEL